MSPENSWKRNPYCQEDQAQAAADQALLREKVSLAVPEERERRDAETCAGRREKPPRSIGAPRLLVFVLRHERNLARAWIRRVSEKRDSPLPAPAIGESGRPWLREAR